MNHYFSPYFAVSGFIITSLGIVCLLFGFPCLEEYLIKKKTALVPGTETYSIWNKSPFPLKMKVYIFNVSNPDEVSNGGIPVFKELGPYVYDEFRIHRVVEISEENDTIKYFEQRRFFFNKEDSKCFAEEDLVTVINAGIVTTSVMVESIAPMALDMVNQAFPYLFPDSKTAFMTGKVKDFLFDGMKMDCQSEEVEMICGAIRNKMPPTLRVADNQKDYLAAMFHHLNGTWEGPYEISRGSANDNLKGKIVSFRDENILSKWGGENCNTFNGTDLTVLPILRHKPKVLYFYLSDFCRSFYSEYENEVEVDGVPSVRYVTKKAFQQEEIYGCFCTKDLDDNPNSLPQCCIHGTLNLQPCLQAPILVSYPHFYLGDPKLLENAKGLMPNKEKHETRIVAEPKTGTPLSIKIRLQMNINLRKVEGIDRLRNVSDIIFPIIWLESGVDVPPEVITQLKKSLDKLFVFIIIEWSLILTGICLMAVAVITNMYMDKICCFAPNRGTRVKTVTTISNKSENKEIVMYPSLYPQLTSENIRDSLFHRTRQDEFRHFD